MANIDKKLSEKAILNSHKRREEFLDVCFETLKENHKFFIIFICIILIYFLYIYLTMVPEQKQLEHFWEVMMFLAGGFFGVKLKR